VGCFLGEIVPHELKEKMSRLHLSRAAFFFFDALSDFANNLHMHVRI